MIVEAATRLLGAEGRTLTTNRIAELAGVSIGSVYQYFGGKQAILNEIGRRHLVQSERAIDEALAQHPVGAQPWQQALEVIVAEAVAQNRSHGPAHGLLRHLVDSAATAADYTAFLNRLAVSLAAYLEHDGRSAASALAAAELTVVGIEAQVHHLAQTSLPAESITRRVTDHAVRALSG